MECCEYRTWVLAQILDLAETGQRRPDALATKGEEKRFIASTRG